MPYSRRILHHGPNPDHAPQLLSLTAIRSCWFELNRQGGCGSGEIMLSDAFDLRDQVEIGDWISFEAAAGERWYLGRVEERRAEVPARVRLRLEGMAIELNQMFPGGFGSSADGKKPQLYGATDLFPLDPDHLLQTWSPSATADDVVRLLLTESLPASSHIRYVPELVEAAARPAPVTSLKVRGEESARSLLKDLALRAQGASWGVDAEGRFFFLQPRDELLATYREGRDLTTLEETRDLSLLFNRILLTGDYVYDKLLESDDVARRSFRWRGNYVEPNSQAQFGDRRIRLWLPWMRTQADSLAFAREFFRTYSQPASRFYIETTGQASLPVPWEGRVGVEDHLGTPLVTARVETLRVSFDAVPCFRMELGPEDPHTLWPEPPQDERWELPNVQPRAGGNVSIDLSGGGGSGGGGGPGGHGGPGGSAESSGAASDPSLLMSSGSAGSSSGSGASESGSIGSGEGFVSQSGSAYWTSLASAEESSPPSLPDSEWPDSSAGDQTRSTASASENTSGSAGSSASMSPSVRSSQASSIASGSLSFGPSFPEGSSASWQSEPDSSVWHPSASAQDPSLWPSGTPSDQSWESSQTPPSCLSSWNPGPTESLRNSSTAETYGTTYTGIHITFLHWTS